MQERLYKYKEEIYRDSHECTIKIHLADKGELSGVFALFEEQSNIGEHYLLTKRIVTDNIHRPLIPNTELLITKKHNFMQWHTAIDKFIAFNGEYDEYKLKDLHLINKQNRRKAPRHIVQLPLSVKPLYNKEYIALFTGCDLSTKGIGLWLPIEYQKYILSNNTYDITLYYKQEPIHLQARCVSRYRQDIFTQGFKAGFEFINVIPDKQLLLQEIINRKHKFLIDNSSEIIQQHQLADYWQSFVLL